ncbi:MAG: FAD-binding oxidoreductase [Chloroflexi bacterium]|nr:FAD-binding oxidoreductase [Chloroflexota bacterium]
MTTSDLLASLRQALPADAIILEDRAREMHSADAFNPVRGFPGDRAPWWETPPVVVLPSTTEQVAAVVKIACQYGTPVIPFGGGTGVMGGAVPPQGAIVIDLKGMSRVRSISKEDRIAWAEAGVVIRDLDLELNRHGLMVGHDPWSTPIATVGGTISTDGVGYRAAKYGSMGDQVAALEVVLPTGEIIRTKAVPKRASGPGLDRLFIGAEGVMGIITAAALRVFRLPEERRHAAFSFPTFETGFSAVSEMFALGLRPAITDLTEEEPEEEGDPPVILILTYEGYREEVSAQARRSKKIIVAHGGADIGPAKAEEYWEERHQPGERFKRDQQPLLPRERWERGWGRGGWGDYLHPPLPVAAVPAYRRQAQAICASAGVAIRQSAIWGGPELYSMVITRPAASHDLGSFREVSDRLLQLAQDMGGSMEYCHGIGLKLLHLAEREWGQNLEAARRLKQALDPYGIMNPGKLGL